MTKKEFTEMFESVIDGRKGFSIEVAGGRYVHVYSDDNIFTANFITRVVEMTGSYFTGITRDSNKRPYLLFNI